jgi:hypothetical protein
MKKHLKKLFKISPHNALLVKSIIILIIFVFFFAFLFWWTNPNRVSAPENANPAIDNLAQNNNSSNSENNPSDSQELTKEANALLGQSTLSFPNVKDLSPEAFAKVPASMKIFILPKATQENFAIINYTDGSHGYYLSYFLANSKIQDAQSQVNDILSKPKSGFTSVANLRAEIFAMSDYKAVSSQDPARVTFIQKGSDTRVILETHTGKI